MGIYKKSIKPKALNKKREQQRDEILNNKKIMKQQKFKIGPYYKVFATAYNVSANVRRILFFSFGAVAIVNAICAIGMDINKKK